MSGAMAASLGPHASTFLAKCFDVPAVIAATLCNPHLELPCRGRTYRIAQPSSAKAIDLALAVARMMDGPPRNHVLQGVEADLAIEALLGDSYGQMLLDGVPPELVVRAAESVIVWMLRDPDSALAHWQAGPDQAATPFVKPAN